MSGSNIHLIAFNIPPTIAPLAYSKPYLAVTASSYHALRPYPDPVLEQFADLTGSVPSDTNTISTFVTADDGEQKLYR